MTRTLTVQRSVGVRAEVVPLCRASYKLAVLTILRESDWWSKRSKWLTSPADSGASTSWRCLTAEADAASIPTRGHWSPRVVGPDGASAPAPAASVVREAAPVTPWAPRPTPICWVAQNTVSFEWDPEQESVRSELGL